MDAQQMLHGYCNCTDCDRSSIEFVEWEAFASYLECWTNTFKSEPSHKDIEEVVSLA